MEGLGTPPPRILLTVTSLSHSPSLQHHRERTAPLTAEHSPLQLPSLLSNIPWMAFPFFAGVFLNFAFRGNSKGHIEGTAGLVYFQVIEREVLSEKSNLLIGLQSNSTRIKDCKSGV